MAGSFETESALSDRWAASVEQAAWIPSPLFLHLPPPAIEYNPAATFPVKADEKDTAFQQFLLSIQSFQFFLK
jgi:hypothetical protein